MSQHNYTRAEKDDGWDINNVDHIDLNGNPILLATDIKVALPDRQFSVRCDGTSCVIEFTPDLNPAEVIILDQTVADHKAISKITQFQNKKIKKIDKKTGDLIDNGFEFPPASGKIFSLSGNAQRKMIGTHEVKDHPALTYPIEWNTKNDLDSILISDAAELNAFYLTGLGTMRAWIDSGTLLKRDVRSATTRAEVNAVNDNR